MKSLRMSSKKQWTIIYMLVAVFLSALFFTTLATMKIHSITTTSHSLKNNEGSITIIKRQIETWIFKKTNGRGQLQAANLEISWKNNPSSQKINSNQNNSQQIKYNKRNPIRAKTQRLQEMLERIQQQLRFAQHQLRSEDVMQKPSKDLAVIQMPVAPMVYENRDFLLCGRDTLKLLVMVMVDYNEKVQREKFRQHWRKITTQYALENSLEMKWKMVFVVGRDREESIRDVYYINEAIFKRDLLNIHARSTQTMGAIYGALHWAHNGCSYDNILVIRPTMGLNTPMLYKLLHEMDKKQNGFFIHDTVKIPEIQQQHQLSQTSELDSLYKNSAMIMSSKTLEKILPLMTMYTGSDIPINYSIIWRYMEMLKFERLHDERFVSNIKCNYQPEYALNVLPSYTCLEIISLSVNYKET